MNERVRIEVPEKFKSGIIITWWTSSICNYKCPYCSPEYNGGLNKFPETVYPILNFLNSIKKKFPDQEIQLEFLGGEPTLWKLLPSFIRKCQDIDINIHLNTNGSPSLKWWEEDGELFSTISYAYHPYMQSEEQLIKNLKIITELKLQDTITLFLLMSLEHFDKNYNLSKLLISKFDNLNVSFKAVRENVLSNKYNPYTNEQKLILNNNNIYSKNKIYRHPWSVKEVLITYSNDIQKIENRNILIRENENNFNGWICNSGIESFQIKTNGDVWRCDNKVGNKLGNLFNNKKIELPDEPIICNATSCVCSQDYSITKWKNI